MTPVFSIILSTWNRGSRILPTIESVLRQSFESYELLIVGDRCDDDTEAAVTPHLSERVSWFNLKERWGSQSGPNNAGIARSRGRYIVYLGHDDLWAPDHLAALAQAYRADPEASFAVSGCIYYGPPGSGYHLVSGMFDDEEVKFTDFFPPSSFSHRREVTTEIGGWRVSEEIRATVDADLLLRAAKAGMRFVSTKRITVHKFAAGLRYLSYAMPDCEEQRLVLSMMAQPGFDDLVSAVLARSRATGLFMGLKYPDFDIVSPGFYHDLSRTGKGILRPPLVPLAGKAVMPQDDDVRPLDWGIVNRSGDRLFRWSGPNPRPRLLLPFTAPGRTQLSFVIHDASDAEVLDTLHLKVNGVVAPWQFRRRNGSGRRAVVEANAVLRAHDHSIVEFDLTGGTSLEDLFRCVDGWPVRIALGEVRLRPERRRWLRPLGMWRRLVRTTRRRCLGPIPTGIVGS